MKSQPKNSTKQEREFYHTNGFVNYDYLICPVCQEKHRELGTHAKKHGYSSREFKIEFGLSKLKCEKIVIRMKGSNNPGYQHGGKLSPFSKKFVSYQWMDEEILDEKLKKDAKKRIVDMTSRGNNSTTIEYYLKRGMTTEEAQFALSERQSTFSLGKCIEKHGETKGTEVWKARQEKWLSTLDAKTDVEKIELNYKRTYRNGSVSKQENFLATTLRTYFPGLETQFHIRREDQPLKNWFYDIRLGDRIIEYNGDFWHANPNKYVAEDVIKFPGCSPKTAKSVWELDEMKIKLAEKNGFVVMVVWESEFGRKEKRETIRRCVEFLSGRDENTIEPTIMSLYE